MTPLKLDQYDCSNVEFPSVVVPRAWNHPLSLMLEDIAVFPTTKQYRQPRLNDAALHRAWQKPVVGRMALPVSLTEVWPDKVNDEASLNKAMAAEWEMRLCNYEGKRISAATLQLPLNGLSVDEIIQNWWGKVGKGAIETGGTVNFKLRLQGENNVLPAFIPEYSNVYLQAINPLDIYFHASQLSALWRLKSQAVSHLAVDVLIGAGDAVGIPAAEYVKSLMDLAPDRICLRLPQTTTLASSKLGQQKDTLYHVIQLLEDKGYGHLAGGWFVKQGDPWLGAQRISRLILNSAGNWETATTDWVVVGPSTASVIGTVQSFNADEGKYVDFLAEEKLPLVTARKLPLDMLVRRAVVEQLLCLGYLDFLTFELAYFIQFDVYFANELKRLQPLIHAGMMEKRQRTLWLTESGRLLADFIARQFFTP